ncbi:MAG: DnaB-like helicase C-terminal domain-containing protein, partial [Bacteroidales bacterium]|nr:DnaB-like helicase C-terminal domain-containing protein [Bacteroidales bacterium]
ALSKAPLYVDDTPGLPVMEFRTKAKRLVKSKGVRLIIVDYLQLMQGPAELRGMREQEVAAISRTLKMTAKELNVPIIALSQLSRDAVKRAGSNGKPMLSDLRESGSIEQDADMVIFVHRPDYLGLSETENGKETTQIIIAKHRNGETRDIDMLFKSEQVRFVELDQTLVAQADAIEYQSAMNMDFPTDGFAGGDEFSNSDFR